MTNPFLYFAYGSNMSPARLRARTPSAEPIEAAWLPGLRLGFGTWGLDRSAKADCERTGVPDPVMRGGLFRLHAADRATRDGAVHLHAAMTRG